MKLGIYSERSVPTFKILENNNLPSGVARNTVYLVILACLNFREFLILRLFTKFRILEFSFFFSRTILIILFARFLNSRICPPREIREN